MLYPAIIVLAFGAAAAVIITVGYSLFLIAETIYKRCTGEWPIKPKGDEDG